jgi:hypothetical protein
VAPDCRRDRLLKVESAEACGAGFNVGFFSIENSCFRATVMSLEGGFRPLDGTGARLTGVVIEAIALNLLEGKWHQGNPLWNFSR